MARKIDIDLGLALLSTYLEPGVGLTQQDIAAWCDCNPGRIGQIERSALAKLRKRLLSESNENKLLKEVLEDYLARHAKADRVIALNGTSA